MGQQIEVKLRNFDEFAKVPSARADKKRTFIIYEGSQILESRLNQNAPIPFFSKKKRSISQSALNKQPHRPKDKKKGWNEILGKS